MKSALKNCTIMKTQSTSKQSFPKKLYVNYVSLEQLGNLCVAHVQKFDALRNKSQIYLGGTTGPCRW